MQIEYCEFPDELLYDSDDNTWVQISNRELIVGLTSLLSAIAGKFTSARLKPPGTRVERGRSLGTLESLKFIGPIPSPATATIISTNTDVVLRPKLVNDYPYTKGWIARLGPEDFNAERVFLEDILTAEPNIRRNIRQFRAHCFKAYPDHEVIEIGAECAAVLVRLNELMARLPSGEVVDVVSDDPTAYVEMVRWTAQTGNRLVDWRMENNLFHFIVIKS